MQIEKSTLIKMALRGYKAEMEEAWRKVEYMQKRINNHRINSEYSMQDLVDKKNQKLKEYNDIVDKRDDLMFNFDYEDCVEII